MAAARPLVSSEWEAGGAMMLVWTFLGKTELSLPLLGSEPWIVHPVAWLIY